MTPNVDPRRLEEACEHFERTGTVRTAATIAGVSVPEMMDLLFRWSLAKRQAESLIESLPESTEIQEGGEP